MNINMTTWSHIGKYYTWCYIGYHQVGVHLQQNSSVPKHSTHDFVIQQIFHGFKVLSD
jgi:hypothetical protein